MKKKPSGFYYIMTLTYFVTGFLFMWFGENYSHFIEMGVLCYLLYELQVIKSKINDNEKI